MIPRHIHYPLRKDEVMSSEEANALEEFRVFQACVHALDLLDPNDPDFKCLTPEDFKLIGVNR